MTLPIDFSTSLWLNNVAIWEWEPDTDASSEPSAACDSTPEPSGVEASDAKSSNPSDPIPAAEPGATRPGYRLVFKGFELAASLFLLAQDGPLARPWIRDTIDHDDDSRRRVREPKPRPDPTPDLPRTVGDDMPTSE